MNYTRTFMLIVLAVGVSHASAARGADAKPVWDVPVLVIRYFPLTADGSRLDKTVTSNVDLPLDKIRAKCDRMTQQAAEALTEGSRFRAYANPDARPSLGYRVVETIEHLEALPHDPKKKGFPDYRKILDREDVKKWVEERGVKEIWIWGYHSKQLAPWESNMASPHGDVSNSDRDPNDLPILKRTYTVYHYNYERDTQEAVHNHIHQIEAVMRHVGGGLWKTFEGTRGNWRAGNCHFPPNAEKDYDYNNPRTVQSDIEDWRPEGFGQMKSLSAKIWDGDSLKWFVYWMRSIPGHDNGLTFKGHKLTNWWAFIGDYDAAVAGKLGMTDAPPAEAGKELLK
jgi:hypothetical protein